MEDQESQPATAAASTSIGDGSPLPSLVTTPSTNASLSPRTPASPPFSTVADSPQKAFPRLNIGGTPAAGALDFSSPPIGGAAPTSPASDAGPGVKNRYKTLADAFTSRGTDSLTHDIVIADLTIAEDGTYLETSSAHAARELKRRYDKQLGVGIKPGVRSPYAITVTQDAQGQPLYRLSSSRPGNGVSVTENEATAPAVPEVMSKSRRLRLSVGALLTSKTSRSPSAGPVQHPTQANRTTPSHARKPPARLVRNVRSNSELRSRSGSAAAGTARYGKQSGSRSNAVDDSHVIARLAHDGDAFSVLLGWSTDRDNESVSSSKDSIDSHGADDEEFGARSPSAHFAHPFGKGVSFTTPHKPLDFSIRRPSSPPQLRYMQSFESGLTARADDHPTFMRPSTRMTSATHASASPYSTEVFDVIQNYKGIPLADTLSAVATETVYKLSSTPSALPKNDPRFVIWGDVRLGGGDDDDENLSQSDASSPTSDTRGEQQRRRRGSSVTESQSSATSASGAQEPLGQRVIVAATIERWIAQLTSELNYVELLDFFLTYRVYITAIDLCHLLICRFHWAVESPDSKQDEMVKKIVRVRTFIAFRYWLSTFFQVDFLRNRELCKILTTWLNSLKADEGIVGQNQDVLDIVRKLKKVVRECKEKWVMKSSASSTAGSSETRLSEQGGSGRNGETENPDADVDLDMGEPPIRPSTDGNSIAALSLNPPSSYHSTQPMLPDLSSPSRPSDVSTISPIQLPSTSGHATTGLSQLHDLQATILAQAKPAVHLKATTVPTAAPTLPMHQSAISRALVNTMGRLGRWKRVLHGRSAVGVAACNDPAAFDMDWGSDSDREFGSIRPSAFASPNQRAAAFPSHTIPSSPPHRRLLGGSGWSTLSAKPAKKVGAEDEDAVVEEIAREAAPASSAPTSTGPAIVPARRLLRTASAIPLNPKLLEEMGVEPSHPETDGTEADEESGPSTPTPGAVPLSAAAAPAATDADNEPAAPPGLDVVNASPRRVLHRPSSSLSMRRISEYKSSPLAPHPELQTTSTSEAPATVPEGEERSSMEEEASVPAIQEPIVPPGLSMPVQTPSVDVMDAHSAHADDFESLADDDDDFHRRPEIVALDDFDLSSSGSDSDGGEVQRNRRPLRRLPNRRDFEFVRRSIDSVSSLGIRSSDAHSSIASGSEVSSRSRASQTGPIYEGEILPWHLDLIEDSDDDQPQDAEAALARLEGHLDANAQKEKMKKVDRWMRMVAVRMAAGETGFFGYLKEEKEEEEEEASAPPSSTAASSDAGLSNPVSEAGDALEPTSAGSSRSASVAVGQEEKPVVSVSIEEPASEASEDEPVEVHTPATDVGVEDTAYVDLVHQQREALGAITPTPPSLDSKVDRLPLTPTLTSPGRRDEEGEAPPPTASTATAETPIAPFPAAEVPQVTSRVAKRRGQNTSSLIRKADILLTNLGTSKVPSTPSIALHRSFILLHRSEALAQHFAMIDRGLFLTVEFTEIVSGTWANPQNDVQSSDVLDWQAYIKERANMKNRVREKGQGPEVSAVAALRARFNMMVAFAATDVVLSHPNERPVVFSKFLRIAWKSYLFNNFATVVALITSLQTPMVSAAMKRLWNRVGMWEMRVFEDLKEFSSSRGNFKFIREAITGLIDRRDNASNGTTSTHSSVSSRARAPVDKHAVPASCIPFIGVYLSDLHRYRKLPDYVDPTSPSSRVESPGGEFASPRHPEVFSTLAPLPPSVQLEPLANVQKQRLTAGTVKEVVAGQHLATKISFDLDRKLYHKCLRLKALPPDKLLDVAKTYGGEP